MKIFINKCLLSENVDTTKINAVVYDSSKDIESVKEYCSIGEASLVFGSIEDLYKVNYDSFFHNYKVSDWLPFLKNEYINWDGYFKQAWQLDSNDIGMFCRSSNSKKAWAGQVIKSKVDIDTINQCCMEDEFLYLSTAKNIINEKRFWIVNENIVEFSHYYNRFSNNADVNDNDNEAVDYVKYIKDICYEPATRYVVDIGFDLKELKFKVIEYNCFYTSGFYNADVNKIIDSMFIK